MLFFIDTADIDEIRRAAAWGLVDGVTTNPSLLAKQGGSWQDNAQDILAAVDGPVSLEVFGVTTEAMLTEARELVRLGPNVVVKIPATLEGLAAVRVLAEQGVSVNVTLVFSAMQALLAARAGAAYVSPFVGRLDDAGHDGMQLVQEILQVFGNYDLSCRVIVASVRHPGHVLQSALLGAHITTVPFSILAKLMNHPLTDKGLEAFLKDAERLA